MPPVVAVALGLAILYAGAEALVRGAASLARRLGVSSLAVGLTVVAYGTSMPELVVSTGAAHAGRGDIAIGNVVGSNIFNIAVILGLAALLQPLHVERRGLRPHMLWMVGASVLLLALLTDGRVGQVDGALLLAGLAAYTIATFRTAGAQEDLPASSSVARDLLLVAGGLAALALGAHLFVEGSVQLARMFGLSDAAISLTLIAAGTSLPELATSVVATVRRHASIALGNVVGSNIFNILGIAGLSGLIAPLQVVDVAPGDLAAMLAAALLLAALVAWGRLARPGGGLLLGAYAAWVYRLWPGS